MEKDRRRCGKCGGEGDGVGEGGGREKGKRVKRGVRTEGWVRWEGVGDERELGER